MRGRRPVAGWPHGRLIGLLDRDVPTTTTLLLLLCTGAHYSWPRVLYAVASVQRSRVSGPRFITLAPIKRTPRYAFVLEINAGNAEKRARPAMRICRPSSLCDSSSTGWRKDDWQGRFLQHRCASFEDRARFREAV